MEKVEFEIGGMHCTGCSARLERVLNNLDGINFAKVSFEDKKATIEYDNDKIRIVEIKEAILDAGFEVKE